MAKYLITLTKTEELLLTVPADSAPEAEALAPDEVRGLDWNNAKIRVQSTRCLTANETNNTVTVPEL